MSDACEFRVPVRLAYCCTLSFDTNGGVEGECSMFLATLAEKQSVVMGEDVNVTMEYRVVEG